MAVAASQIRIQQRGDAMIGERVDRVYDEKTGMIGEKKTTVATVPMEGGGTAVLVGEEYTAAQLHAPQYQAHRSYQPQAIRYHDEPAEPEKQKESSTFLRCFWLLCGCFTFTASLAILIALGAAQVVACPPLQGVGATGFILGAITLVLSCICCACICNGRNGLVNCICWLLVTLLVLAFLGTLIANTVYVADNIEFIFSNGIYNVTVPIHCAAPTLSLGVLIISYILFILFVLFCICTTFICSNVLLSSVMGEGNNA